MKLVCIKFVNLARKIHAMHCIHFKASVGKNYDKLFDDEYWKRINTDGKTENQVYEEVHKIVLEAVELTKSTETETLWP